jgi:hypothetical protein
VNYTVNNGMMEVLIECHTSSNPEVQALWDEKNHKLYLVGGHKCDPRPEPTDPNGISAISASYAWIRIDLNQLSHKGEIPIYVRVGVKWAGPDKTILEEKRDELLITINNEGKSN